MSEQNPEDPTPETSPPPEPESDEASGYAVYDKTLLRFVSGVVPTKAAADKLKRSGAKGHDLEVRKV